MSTVTCRVCGADFPATVAAERCDWIAPDLCDACAAETISAVFDRRGVIEIMVCSEAPKGMLLLAAGPRWQVEPVIQTQARHGYEPGVLLVPGIPEAGDDDDAMDTAIAFRARVQNALRTRGAR